MDNKRTHSKRAIDENRLLEMEKKRLIEERLRSLAEQIRAQDNRPKQSVPQLPVKQPIEEKRIFDHGRKRCADSGTSESETICESTSEL